MHPGIGTGEHKNLLPAYLIFYLFKMNIYQFSDKRKGYSVKKTDKVQGYFLRFSDKIQG